MKINKIAQPQIKVNLNFSKEDNTTTKKSENEKKNNPKTSKKAEAITNTTMKVKLIKNNALGSIKEEHTDGNYTDLIILDNFETYDAKARELLKKYEHK